MDPPESAEPAEATEELLPAEMWVKICYYMFREANERRKRAEQIIRDQNDEITALKEILKKQAQNSRSTLTATRPWSHSGATPEPHHYPTGTTDLFYLQPAYSGSRLQYVMRADGGQNVFCDLCKRIGGGHTYNCPFRKS